MPSDTLFEKLVKLQHYGYRTRLLDLTSNTLVALYFACWDEKHHDKDGELIILDIPDAEVKYDDSDTVAILSALSLRSKEFNLADIKQRTDKLARTGFNNKMLDEFCKISERNEMKNRLTHQNPEIGQLFSNHNEHVGDIEMETLLAFNQQKEITALLHDIRTDKPSFRPVIEVNDLSKVICVRAKMNNARISRQQGSFLIYGIDENKCTPAKMPDDWQQKSSQNEKFIIKAESKAKIIQELKSFGISTRILFPELEKQAEEIMSQY